MGFIEDQFSKLLQCWQFLTRIPLPSALERRIDHNQTLAEAAHLFPVAGFAIGAAAAGIWLVACSIWPTPLAAGLTILAAICITGALHEDGLADSADGLFGGQTKERRLEIMKDSTIGSFGAIALTFTIAFRWVALAHCAPMFGAAALLLSHTGARAVMTYPICFSRYARAHGIGSAVADGLSFRGFGFALGFSALIAALFGGTAGLLALLLALLAGVFFLKLLELKLDGYTGDGLGATQQLSEIVILTTLASMGAVR